MEFLRAHREKGNAPSPKDREPLGSIEDIWTPAAQMATVGIFILLLGAFLYFSRPVLLPVVAAVLIGTTLAPIVKAGARIVGRVASPDIARVSTGVKGSGAQGLLGGGDFIINLNAELIRFQAGAVSQAEVSRAVDLILSCSNAYPQPDHREAASRNSATSRRRDLPAGEPRQLHRIWSGE